VCGEVLLNPNPIVRLDVFLFFFVLFMVGHKYAEMDEHHHSSCLISDDKLAGLGESTLTSIAYLVRLKMPP
jgi:hypothetical protein